MSGFAADWLQLREPVDLAAQNAALTQAFAAALDRTPGRSLRIVDLGAGTGAAFRALAPQLGGDQEWTLVDHDPALLAAQAATMEGWVAACGWRCRRLADGVRIETGAATWVARAQPLDLARDLEQLELAAYDGVTTTALLDLVSTAWLDRFAAWLARVGRPLLARFTVDGRRDWRPTSPLDAPMQAAFERHQAGDKGFGPALGARATAAFVDQLALHRFDLSTGRSDWRLGTAHRAVLSRLLAETVTVVREVEGAAASRLAEWQAERQAQWSAGSLQLTVGHVDLLAVPRRE